MTIQIELKYTYVCSFLINIWLVWKEPKQDKVIEAIKAYEGSKKNKKQKESKSKILNSIKKEKPQAAKDDVCSIVWKMNWLQF